MKFDAAALLALKFSRDKSRWRMIETTYDDRYMYLLYPCYVLSTFYQNYYRQTDRWFFNDRIIRSSALPR